MPTLIRRTVPVSAAAIGIGTAVYALSASRYDLLFVAAGWIVLSLATLD